MALTRKNKDTVYAPDRRCPVCQYPFRFLTGQRTPSWHVDECMAFRRESFIECTSGIRCNSSSESHFQKYNHSQLANQLSQGSTSRHAKKRKVMNVEDTASEQECKQGKCEANEFAKAAAAPCNSMPTHMSSEDRVVMPLTEVSLSELQQSQLSGCSSIEERVRCWLGDLNENSSANRKTALSVKNSTRSCSSLSKSPVLFEGTKSSFSASSEMAKPDDDDDITFSIEARTASGQPQASHSSHACESIGDSDRGHTTVIQTRTLLQTCCRRHDSNLPLTPYLEAMLNDNALMETSFLLNSPTKQRQRSLCLKKKLKKNEEVLQSKAANETHSSSAEETFVTCDDKHTSGSYTSTMFTAVAAEKGANYYVQPQASVTIDNFSGRQLTKNVPATSVGNDIHVSARKVCPFYKKIDGTRMVVDAFKYGSIPGVVIYFLSHFHFDHYNGLTKKFPHAVHCNEITANLMMLKLGVPKKKIVVLPMNSQILLDGIHVTLLEANHCPGAAMFLFETSTGNVHLHTGDFRAHPDMESVPQLLFRRIHTLFLDTTYLNPQYVFPTQEEVIKFAADVAKRAVQRKPKTLIVCGTYCIGKEKVFAAMAEALSSKVFASVAQRKVLQCLGDANISSVLTADRQQARIHLVTMNMLKHEKLLAYLQECGQPFDNILAFRATGWTQGKQKPLSQITPNIRGQCAIWGIPYSEHSSFTELRRFVRFIRPQKIVPTVNVSKARNMNIIFRKWLDETTSNGSSNNNHRNNNSCSSSKNNKNTNNKPETEKRGSLLSWLVGKKKSL